VKQLYGPRTFEAEEHAEGGAAGEERRLDRRVVPGHPLPQRRGQGSVRRGGGTRGGGRTPPGEKSVFLNRTPIGRSIW